MDITSKGPDFLGIGMERAGTSWLFTQLAAHPEIWVPPIKELHFFDVIDPQACQYKPRYSYHLKARLKQKLAPFIDTALRPELSKNDYITYLLWDLFYFTGKFDLDWYKRLFDERFTGGRVSGEITPYYGHVTPETIQKMLEMNANLKFILMVRDPVERAWSGLVHEFLRVKNREFETITETEMLEWLDSDAALLRSDINSVLDTWSQHVPDNQLLVCDFADIKNAPETLIAKTYGFLGVDAQFLPPENLYRQKINTYTKQNFDMPNAVREKLNARYGSTVETMDARLARAYSK